MLCNLLLFRLPFSFVVILMMISFFKDANQERKFLGLTLQPDHQRKKDYIKHNTNQQSKMK